MIDLLNNTEFEEELHPLEINLTKLICNLIPEQKYYDVTSEFISQWRDKFIDVLEKTHLKDQTDYISWQTLWGAQNRTSIVSRRVSDKIYGHFDMGKEFIINLRSSEALYLTNNKCIDTVGNSFKTIKTSEIDKYQLTIAMLSKLIEIDVLDIKSFLNFQLKANFNDEVFKMTEFLTNLLLKYSGVKNMLSQNQVNSVEYFIKMKEEEYQDHRFKSLVNENELLKKQLLELKDENKKLRLKVVSTENQNTPLKWIGLKTLQDLTLLNS